MCSREPPHGLLPSAKSTPGRSPASAASSPSSSLLGPVRGDIDFDGYADANTRFHRALAALPGSGIIERELERVWRLPFASPSAFLPDKEDFVSGRRSLDLAQAQHRAIVEAIAGREGARAEHLAREHAHTARNDMEHVLRERSGGGRECARPAAGLTSVTIGTAGAMSESHVRDSRAGPMLCSYQS